MLNLVMDEHLRHNLSLTDDVSVARVAQLDSQHVHLLTSPRQNKVDGSVTDRSITGLNVHERFAAHSHKDPLLHTQLCNSHHVLLRC